MVQGIYPAQIPQDYQGIVVYAYGVIDPRIVATSGAEGQLYLLLPDGVLLKKLDDGVTTNWQSVNSTTRLEAGALINATLQDSVLISSVASTINLPIASDNQKITIKAVAGATVVPNGADTIDGAANLVLAAQEFATLIKRGTVWYRIG